MEAKILLRKPRQHKVIPIGKMNRRHLGCFLLNKD